MDQSESSTITVFTDFVQSSSRLAFLTEAILYACQVVSAANCVRSKSDWQSYTAFTTVGFNKGENQLLFFYSSGHFKISFSSDGLGAQLTPIPLKINSTKDAA